ncbi:TfoX/Sxy family DNA transformation protein [Vibrio genomosp. F10]|nr:TfoX/Sxy family DNA transformation protein [Vibrio genomosp. F10]
MKELAINYETETAYFKGMLPNVRLKSMFGHFAVFSSGCVCIRFCNGEVFFRIDPVNYKKFSKYTCDQTLHHNKGSSLYNYYKLNVPYDSDIALRIASAEIQVYLELSENDQVQSLSSLPNVTRKHIRVLKSVDITDVDCLMKLGTEKVLEMIRSKVPKTAIMAYALVLEGAIEGVHSSVVNESRKRKLERHCSNWVS